MASSKLLRGRYSTVGAYYAITTCAVNRKAIFASSTAATAVERQIRVCEAGGLTQNMAWVVMPDHVHWMFELRQGALAACVQRFKSCSARSIRAVTRSSGSLWLTGYYDHRLRDDEDLAAQARYIVDNPVRKGLANHWRDYPHAWCRWPLP